YRATADIDIIARITDEDVDKLAALLHDRFYVDTNMMRDAIAQRSAFNVLDLETGYKVGIFVDPGDSFSHSQFDRKQLMPSTAEGTPAYVASAEDTILAKLHWYDAGGRKSDRQWTDILGVLRVQRNTLDRDYLTRWASKEGIGDLLEAALT